MTGLFGRFRAWLGSLFGGDADDEDDEPASEESRLEGGGPTVAHRDDRPLETPDRPPAESTAAATDVAETDPNDDTTDDGPVSIPDAEGGATGDERSDGEASGRVAEATADDGDGTPSDEDDAPAEDEETAADDDSVEGFECAVCGTSVDDPAYSCPLCRSTEVVPATESTDGGS